ncbi:MAG: DUF6768 family protein [Phycisphaerales bacterium]
MNLDNEIRNALNTNLDPHLATAGDEGLFEQVAATFRGRMRFWIVMTWVGAMILVGVFIWSAISFYAADHTRDWVLYASIAMLCFMGIGHIKLWYYMEMNRNTHTREIKRMELMLARLGKGSKE